MPFVKLDCGMLNSTIWFDREAREVFITALLMAEPQELVSPEPQIKTRSLGSTGWSVPPGWYGYVPASGPGLIHRAGLDAEVGMAALERLASPEKASRSKEFDGRRLVRVNGGFIVLNFMRYRERDYTTAERSRRYRERKSRRHTVTTPHHAVISRDVTQAEAQAEEDNLQVGGSVDREDNGPPTLPPADRAERAIAKSTDALRDKLYALVDEMALVDPKQRDQTELMRLVTGYTRTDGKDVKGVVNAHLLTFERLEKSINDAELNLNDWKAKP